MNVNKDHGSTMRLRKDCDGHHVVFCATSTESLLRIAAPLGD